MADGSVIIEFEGDLKKLYKDVASAEKLLDKTEKALAKKQEKSSKIIQDRQDAVYDSSEHKEYLKAEKELNDALQVREKRLKKISELESTYAKIKKASSFATKYEKKNPGLVQANLKRWGIPKDVLDEYRGLGSSLDDSRIFSLRLDKSAAQGEYEKLRKDLLTPTKEQVKLDSEINDLLLDRETTLERILHLQDSINRKKKIDADAERIVEEVSQRVDEEDRAWREPRERTPHRSIAREGLDAVAAGFAQFNKSLLKASEKTSRKVSRLFGKMFKSIGDRFKALGKSFYFFNLQVRTALLWGVLLAPLMKVFDTLSDNLFAVAMQSNAFSQSLANLKGTIWTASAPALVALTDWLTVFMDKLAVAITYVGTFINALFGLSAVSKKTVRNFATAKDAAKGAGKTKKDKSLASWDTVQRLTKPAGGSGAGSSAQQPVAPTFEQDFSKAEEALKRFKELLATSGWYGVGVAIGDRINNAIASIDAVKIARTLSTVLKEAIRFATGVINTTDFKLIGEKIRDFFLNIDWDGIFRATGTLIVSALKQMVEFVEGLLGIDLSFLTRGISLLAQALTGLYNLVTGEIGFSEFFNNLSTGQIIVDALIAGFLIFKGVLLALSPVTKMIAGAFKIFTPVIKIVGKIFNVIGTSVLPKIVSLFTKIGTFVMPLVTKTLNIMVPVVKALALAFAGLSLKTKIIIAVISAVVTAFMFLRGTMDQWLPVLKNWIDTVVQKFVNFGDKIKGVFTGIGNKIKEVVGGVKSGIKNRINELLSMIERAINWVVDRINSLDWSLPNWVPFVGGKHLGFNVPRARLPRLAEGGLVNPGHEFAAILGDNRREQEIVSPVSTMKQALMDALAESGRSYRGDIVLELDGHEFARIANPLLQNETNRVGIVATGG